VTREQERAAVAARRDCIAWGGVDEPTRKQAAALADYLRVYLLRNNVPKEQTRAIEKAYRAGWRTTYETR
jgi:hypothetical protein